MIRVLVVDDHAIFRKGLIDVLSEEPDITVSDEAVNGREAIERVRNGTYDVVLMDISMPEVNGLDALKEIKRIKPGLPVVMLSMYPEDQFALRSLKDKAAGYVNKTSSPDDIISALRKASRGEQYITESVGEALAKEYSGGSKSIHDRLSEREFTVFLGLAGGKTLKQIAAETNLSAKTISTYRGRILQKMGMTSNAELVRYALKYGFTD